jgi:hypothetical protein
MENQAIEAGAGSERHLQIGCASRIYGRVAVTSSVSNVRRPRGTRIDRYPGTRRVTANLPADLLDDAMEGDRQGDHRNPRDRPGPRASDPRVSRGDGPARQGEAQDSSRAATLRPLPGCSARWRSSTRSPGAPCWRSGSSTSSRSPTPSSRPSSCCSGIGAHGAALNGRASTLSGRSAGINRHDVAKEEIAHRRARR